MTVFGQHGHSQRTEFTVPLLSLGQEITARVAFDSWLDPNIRGKERPFLLAFLADKTTGKSLSSHLDKFIFEYLDKLKDQKADFEAEQIWGRIVKSITTPVDRERFDAISFEVDSEYAISRAKEDLETAKDAWENLKDRNQLWTALRVANRLENVDDEQAGTAFILVGQIFLAGNSFQEAAEAFEKAVEAFTRARQFEGAGEASYLAGKSVYHLQEYEKAIELFQAATIWIKEPALIASLNFEMGIVLHEQSHFEEANSCFEKAIKLAEKIDKRIASEYSSTFASRLMFQADREKEENPTYSLGLIRKSAEKRIDASTFLQQTGENPQSAATSLILAVSAYFSLGNIEKAVNLLEDATNLFLDSGDYLSAGRALFDGARTVTDNKRSHELLSRAVTLLKEQEGLKEKRLLGLIHFEKAKIEEQNNQFSIALNSLNYSVQYLTESNAPVSDIVPVQIQFANTLFRIEDFETAADYFLTATKRLSTLPSSEIVVDQQNKTLMNALISLRRASTAYHNAAIIALKEKDEKRASEMFAHSISLLINWAENNPSEQHNEVQKVIKKRISRLSLQEELALLAETKYKLDSIIKSLKMILESLGSET
ncbi:MAG: tetratricopeptide repeat protein [Candidatus Heimdallarchaeota archaeon]|nr:MAG: tetratricopeptide repeat protein [Candidatus Heimdallarchaeota archaeon]